MKEERELEEEGGGRGEEKGEEDERGGREARTRAGGGGLRSRPVARLDNHRSAGGGINDNPVRCAAAPQHPRSASQRDFDRSALGRSLSCTGCEDKSTRVASRRPQLAHAGRRQQNTPQSKHHAQAPVRHDSHTNSPWPLQRWRPIKVVGPSRRRRRRLHIHHILAELSWGQKKSAVIVIGELKKTNRITILPRA